MSILDMKFFLVTSPRSEPSVGVIVEQIYSQLRASGHIVVNDHRLLHHPTPDEKQAYIKQLIVDIKKADVCIFEASIASLGVGQLIGMALQHLKPVIILHKPSCIPEMISTMSSDFVQVICYNPTSLSSLLKNAVQSASKKILVRFNLLIPPNMMQYLTQASKKAYLSKSDFVRLLIQEHQRKSIDAHKS